MKYAIGEAISMLGIAIGFSDMDFLREFTGLSYQVMFTGIE